MSPAEAGPTTGRGQGLPGEVNVAFFLTFLFAQPTLGGVTEALQDLMVAYRSVSLARFSNFLKVT